MAHPDDQDELRQSFWLHVLLSGVQALRVVDEALYPLTLCIN
jgi:hypothetical protein